MDNKEKAKLHKVLGVGIGWVMGGPVGAALGLLVGHTLQNNPELLKEGLSDTSLKPYYDVLQVSYDAEAHDIKAAYKRLIKKYHPDKFANTDPVIKELAKGKMAEINGAYEKLMKRGTGGKGGD